MEEGYFNPRGHGLHLHVILKHFSRFGRVQKQRRAGSTLHIMARPWGSSGAPQTAVPKAALARFLSSPIDRNPPPSSLLAR